MIQALLIALWVTWAIIDEQTFQFQTTRPIITGPVVGLLMGDLKTGLIVGATIELMFLATIFVGTAVPPDPTLSTALATAFAVFAGGGVDVAIGAAIPIALIGQVVQTLQLSVFNVFFLHRADKFAAAGDGDGITRQNHYALGMNFIFYGVPTFLAIYFGREVVLSIIEAIPDKMITGLAVGGGMIGAVGFALLLSTLKSKKLWPFFIIGFIFASYLKVNMLGIGLLAVTCTALYLLVDQKIEEARVDEDEL